MLSSQWSPALELFVAVLATWRICHLFAHEDGPFDLIVRLRAPLGDSELGRMLDCTYCLSLWVAMPFAWLLTDSWLGAICTWLAISGGACLLDRIVARSTSHEPALTGEQP